MLFDVSIVSGWSQTWRWKIELGASSPQPVTICASVQRNIYHLSIYVCFVCVSKKLKTRDKICAPDRGFTFTLLVLAAL